MKRFLAPVIFLLVLSHTSLLAQSKLSFSVLANQSASADDEYSICILRTTGGECVSLERQWKTNVTLAVNYQAGKKLRLQSGVGYNTLVLNEVNEAIGRDAYRINYLSIPLRSHFFIAQGKVSFYAGMGLRTDIRLGDAPTPDPEVGSLDNGQSLAMSAELLLGLDVQVLPQITLGLEPTFSRGITRYDKALPTNLVNALISRTPMVVDYPQRLGFSLSATYRLK